MGRIMIIDDSRLARTFSAASLRKAGHDVLEVEPTSIFDVLKAVKETTPDLLVMDFLMPNCPGISLARVCHEDPGLQAMRMLVLTAHRDDEVTQRLHNLGVAEVLYKPLDSQTLTNAVARALGAGAP
jgi:CheY-like chemotaxis protein